MKTQHTQNQIDILNIEMRSLEHEESGLSWSESDSERRNEIESRILSISKELIELEK